MLKNMFEEIDADGSGFIDRDELNQFLDKICFTYNVVYMTKKLKQKNFIKLDKNKDNKISFEEIIPYLTKIMRIIVAKSKMN